MDEMENVDGVQICAQSGERTGQPGARRRCCRTACATSLESDKWQLWLINSEYRVASDAVNEQIDQPSMPS